MIKRYIIVLMMFCFCSLSYAQTRISNQEIVENGKTVTISFDVDTDKTDIPARRKEVILPYIYQGKDTLFLDALEVYGKGRFKRERQENALSGDYDWELGANQILKDEGIYRYSAFVPLKKWMKSVGVGIKRQIVGCACEKDMVEETLADGITLFQEPQVQRRIPSYCLEELEKRNQFASDNMEITFKVSRTEVEISLFNNEVSFNRILETLDRITQNENLKIVRLHIIGFASPEGPQKFNEWLGINRAKSLISAIIEQRPELGLSEEDFEVHNGEENWDGLHKVLAASDMEQKAEVLKIIDDESLSAESKKERIRRIAQGAVWDKLVNEIYPYLRSVKFQAEYYDTTDDLIAEKVSQANDLIREAKYSEAGNLMDEYKDDPRVANVIGVSLMMQGKFEEAVPWLQTAKANGSKAAESNIAAIDAEYEFEAKQKKIIEEYLKNL